MAVENFLLVFLFQAAVTSAAPAVANVGGGSDGSGGGGRSFDICVFYWTLPGCPLATVLGVDVMDNYDWAALCAQYPDFLANEDRCLEEDLVVDSTNENDDSAGGATTAAADNIVEKDLDRNNEKDDEIALDTLENLLYQFNRGNGQIKAISEHNQHQQLAPTRQHPDANLHERFGLVDRQLGDSLVRISRPRKAFGGEQFVIKRIK